MSTMTLPSEPVRVYHDWQNAKRSFCAQCGVWKQCVPIDGDYTCAGCIDGNRVAEWQDYARQLRSILDAHLRREVKVPDDMVVGDPRNPFRHGTIADGYACGWNACREAIIAAASTSVATDGQGGEG